MVWLADRARAACVRLIYLENEFDVPVMAGVVGNLDDRLPSYRFAARPDPAEASLKAWAALGRTGRARRMQDPAGPFWSTTAKMMMGDQGLKPPREDRRYLDVYRNDFHDVTTLLCQLRGPPRPEGTRARAGLGRRKSVLTALLTTFRDFQRAPRRHIVTLGAAGIRGIRRGHDHGRRRHNRHEGCARRGAGAHSKLPRRVPTVRSATSTGHGGHTWLARPTA